jgi:hypothetical protein
MAVAANALTTSATAIAEISGSSGSTSTIERLINVASEAIATYCGREFQLKSRAEYHVPPHGERLLLKNFPVVTSSPGAAITVSLDGTSITDFTLEDADTGILRLVGGWGGTSYDLAVDGSVAGAYQYGSGRRVLLVTYYGGYVLPNDTGTRTLPYELEQACIDTVASLWRRRGVDLSGGSFDGSNDAIGRGLGGIIPGPLLPTLNRYMRRLS